LDRLHRVSGRYAISSSHARKPNPDVMKYSHLHVKLAATYGAATPRPMMTMPWLEMMADMALFLWWMKTMSCTISGISASTAPAPSPCTARAARCWLRLVDRPAQIPPAQAAAAAKSSTGRRPTAMESGTRR
jgi:hypothetical protein